MDKSIACVVQSKSRISTIIKWFDTQEHVLRMRTFQKQGKLLTNKLMLQGYNESHLKSSFRKFYGRYYDLANTNYHWSICWMICVIVVFILALTRGNLVSSAYLISTKDTQRVWAVSRGCLLLLNTWSYLHICQGSVLQCTRFCICSLDFDDVEHIINFAILYFVLRSWPLKKKFRCMKDILYSFSSLFHWKKKHQNYNPNFCKTRMLLLPTTQSSSLN
jgi:hypothetical protein